MNIQHSSRTDEWYTPLDILVKVREVLGHIDCDPATDMNANTRVMATIAITRDGELESTRWNRRAGTVFVNPPGSRKGNKSKTGMFWRRMMQERDSGLLTHGIFLCFSIEALQHTQRLGCPSIGEFPFCVPRQRIKFDRPDGTQGPAPSHSNAIVYVPGTVDKREVFRKVFGTEGIIING